MRYPYEQIWKTQSSLKSLFAALAGNPDQSEATVRFAGGCVRDLLLGKIPQDYDLATTLSPQEVMSCLDKQSIPILTHGLSHGTVTAIVDSKPFEITTLREDLKPDGRHTSVAYLKDWQQDALRRDFTINALYMDWNGQIYDSVGGLFDLENKIVQFVGNPKIRIQEDYLRLLRWFRMSACFGTPHLSPTLMSVFQTYAPHLKRLSRERKQEEFFKIIKSPHLIEILLLMKSSEVLINLCPFFDLPPFLERLTALKRGFDQELNPCLILGALLIHLTPEQLLEAFTYLRLSKPQTQFIKAILAEKPFIFHNTTQIELLKKSYFLEQKVFEAVILLKLSQNISGESLEKSLFEVQKLCTWAESIRSTLVFPLNGNDLIEAHMKPGPEFGKLLHHTKVFWLESSPHPNKMECLEFLKKRLQ